ncbi:MAG TPA: 3-methyl-2-oxobutanoate hydroxymethyltransferase [Gammaproteobacteria bacterium]|jgi:3-methyl-2-oxobutanoate hydroxymethyltransferase|nr:3-methyl-2-oxobutanoate hydroxymethyltransferase [Gammaproteobacteria bacterium]
MSSQASPKGVVTVKNLRKYKATGKKFTSLTAYDAAFAAVLDEAGIDVVLVGDSLGMVVQGLDTTIPVSMDDIIYHSQTVARGLQRAMLMVDMPFMSYATEEQALHNASRLMKEGGAQIVKLEWGALQLGMVRRFTECGIPVCAHLGLTPQTYFKMGGYKVQGRDDLTASRMLDDALALEEAGADVLLLECVPRELAKKITESVSTPVIGIGAGPDVDGQVLVLYDILDIAPGKRTRFSKNYMRNNGAIQDAIKQYDQEVRDGTFPSDEHSFE